MIIRVQGNSRSVDEFDAVAVGLDSVEALDEVKLAEYLASDAFRNKKNIANKFKYEFLLWLSGKRDITSAIEETEPKGSEFFLVIFSGDVKKILAKIKAIKLELKIKKNAEPLRLEKIALSRLK
ncbi:Uncharacterised protein [Candidatus Bilamarchaeum dharawalense]|uniref:Uncharacterized protein n=1 Tax=Candidatus Bilamarchaeum dharawalense TaxID=2885759 RepID=A0A5E4LUH1_9ARCH|nr:Uncharacterised protein [Candidatus Bilamarchaeum dharawalense]